MVVSRKVAESFQYAADGIHPRLMRAGRSYPFPADHAARFEDEGKLEPLPALTATQAKRARPPAARKRR